MRGLGLLESCSADHTCPGSTICCMGKCVDNPNVPACAERLCEPYHIWRRETGCVPAPGYDKSPRPPSGGGGGGGGLMDQVRAHPVLALAVVGGTLYGLSWALKGKSR